MTPETLAWADGVYAAGAEELFGSGWTRTVAIDRLLGSDLLCLATLARTRHGCLRGAIFVLDPEALDKLALDAVAVMGAGALRGVDDDSLFDSRCHRDRFGIPWRNVPPGCSVEAAPMLADSEGILLPE